MALHPRHIIQYRGTRVWLVGKLVARVLFATFLIFGTYNPSGRSYWHWLHSTAADPIWKLVATGLLLVAYAVAIPVMWRALGFGGTLLTTTLATTAAWVLIQSGWVDLAAPDHPLTWITLSVAAFVLGVGLCWMLMGRILDGQIRTRDINR